MFSAGMPSNVDPQVLLHNCSCRHHQALASIFHDLDTDCRRVDFALIVFVVGA